MLSDLSLPMIVPRPPFLIFEGIDGAGKTTLARAVARALGASYFHEPATFLLGEAFTNVPEHTLARCYLMLCQSAWLYDHAIRPRLWRGEAVVLDRCPISTWVYNAPEDQPLFTRTLVDRELSRRRYAHVVWVDTPVEEAARRRADPDSPVDLAEALAALRERYAEYFRTSPPSLVVNGVEPVETNVPRITRIVARSEEQP